jgi:hypothetical protein
MKKGDKGRNVEELQSLLKAHGFYSGKIDGDFGPGTETWVKKFQKSKGLKDDGIVGKKTYAYLLEGVDTDRTGFDENATDTDGVVAMLGSYTTAEGLVIDKAYLDTDEYVRDYGKVQPINLFIHHTAGWNNPYSTVKSWNGDSRGRVATQFVMGGTSILKGKYGDDQYNGTVVECFPDNYVGWHTGKVKNFTKVSKLSCGIEICNFGYAEKKGDKYYNYVNVEVPADMICDLGYEFRGHQYWHKYTDEQIESLRLLILHIKKIYPKIDLAGGLPRLLKSGVSPKDAFEYNSDCDNGKELGVWTHTNIRKDKFDCAPQPKLIEMLKSL